MSLHQPNTASVTNNTDPPLTVHGPGPMVTRIRRRAIMITFLLGSALVMMVLLVGFNSSTPSRRIGGTEEASNRPTGPGESVRDLPGDYSFDVRRAAQSINYDQVTKPPVIVVSTAKPQGVAIDPNIAEQLKELAELRRKLLEQQKREADQALDSPLVFASVRSSRMAELPSLPTTMPNWRGTNNTIGNNPSTPSADSSPTAKPHTQNELFFSKAALVEPYLHKPLVAPVSKYELKAGSVIPAALLTSINTDLPGDVIAQVTEDVYDSVTGDILLIPKGSRLLGTYHSLIANGQNRALLAWQRLIYADGRSIVLDAMPGTDPTGAAGVADQVDYHPEKLVMATALSTAIAATGNLARNPKAASGTTSFGDVIGDSVAQESARVSEKIINRELDVQPTITIRSGWPLRVLVNKDIVLAPPADDAQHP